MLDCSQVPVAQGLSRHAGGCARVNRWTVLLKGVYILPRREYIFNGIYTSYWDISSRNRLYEVCDINSLGRTN